MSHFLKRHPKPIRSVWRRIYTPLNTALYPILHVNEFPKCGGTWLCKVLSQGLGWRFDDNTYPWFGPALVKHHRIQFKQDRVITLVRDPRDVAVSFFHFSRSLKRDTGFNSGIVSLMKEHVFTKAMPEAEALDCFVDRMIHDPVFPNFTWGDFYRHPDRQGAYLLRYEDLRADTFGALSEALQAVGQSFDADQLHQAIDAQDINKLLKDRAQSGAQSGADTAKASEFFVRSGKLGEGKETLSDQALAWIEEDAGDLLDRFGYR